ncbi:MAG: hypothetical protein DWQ37_20945 [Planctomycetota bacterium]|nr:MAG: hypothetical protein DWQ37_20945 [Planctomycetota bacterium]
MAASIKVDLASPPDRKRLVAQIMVGNEQWAELNQEQRDLELEFYTRSDGRPWVLSFDDAVGALNLARQRLIG